MSHVALRLRRSLGALLAVLTVVVLSACGPFASSDRGAAEGTDERLTRFTSQEISWRGCGRLDAFLSGSPQEGAPQCARIDVPVDYADPAGATIEVAVVRQLAADPTRRGNLLVLNPGGPGFGASPLLIGEDGYRLELPILSRSFDVVTLDLRATGHSGYLSCGDRDLSSRMHYDDIHFEEAVVRERSLALDAEFAATCLQRNPSIFEHLSTRESAQDLDVLRAVLGAERLNFLGWSYGTALGSVYADLFPGRTGRMVLDGAVDLATPAAEHALQSADALQQGWLDFLAGCEESDCALPTDIDQAQELVDRLLSQLQETPLPVTDAAAPDLSAQAALGALLTPLYDPWSDVDVAQGVVDALDGNGQTLSDAAAFAPDNPLGRFTSGDGAALAVTCLDRPADLTAQEVTDLTETLHERSPMFGALVARQVANCAQWPGRSPQPVPTGSARGAGEILVIGSSGDSITPWSAARSLADRLDTASLLTFDGLGHGVVGDGVPCIDDAVNDFLVRGVAAPSTCTLS